MSAARGERLPGKLRLVAGCQLVLSLLLAIGIWEALPARYLPVDLLGSALSLLCAAAGLGLLWRAGWALPVAIVACWASFVLGALTVTLLSFVVAHLAGLYGPVGSGGALLMGTIAVLVVPYFVGLPLLQLCWLAAGAAEAGWRRRAAALAERAGEQPRA